MYRPNTTGSKGDGGVNAQFYIITDMEMDLFMAIFGKSPPENHAYILFCPFGIHSTTLHINTV